MQHPQNLQEKRSTVQQGNIPFKDEKTKTPLMKSTRLFCGVSDSYSGSTGGLVFPLTSAIYRNSDSNPVLDVCLRLGPPWLNCGFSLAPTVCMLRALFIVSS